MVETRTLDDDLVGSLEVPAGKRRRVFWDEELAGFGVRVSSSGWRSWIIGFRAMRPGGRVGDQQRVIGIPGEMTVEEARRKAREALAALQNDGRQTAPLAGPAAADVSRNDAAAEEEPEAGTAAMAGVRYNPDEARSVDEEQWVDEGLEIEHVGPDARWEPEAIAGDDADRIEDILARTMEDVTGTPYREIAVGRREQSAMPRVPAETGAGEVDEAGVAGPIGDINRGEGGTAPSGPGRMERALKAVSETAGKAALMAKKAERSPAQEDARHDLDSGPSGKGEAGEGSEGSDERKLAARKVRNAGVEETHKLETRLSDETVASLAGNLDDMRVVMDRIEAWNAQMSPQIEELSGAAAVLAKDRRRVRRRRTGVVLAMVAVMAVGLGGGVALQSRVEVVPQLDPTRGWKDHVWNYYGEAFMGCFQRAKNAESGYADCTIKVRAR